MQLQKGYVEKKNCRSRQVVLGKGRTKGNCCTELDQFWFHQLLCRVS